MAFFAGSGAADSESSAGCATAMGGALNIRMRRCRSFSPASSWYVMSMLSSGSFWASASACGTGVETLRTETTEEARSIATLVRPTGRALFADLLEESSDLVRFVPLADPSVAGADSEACMAGRGEGNRIGDGVHDDGRSGEDSGGGAATFSAFGISSDGAPNDVEPASTPVLIESKPRDANAALCDRESDALVMSAIVSPLAEAGPLSSAARSNSQER